MDGETREVENVTIEHLDELVKVYNFEVEDWHTYYVTEQEVLVHNVLYPSERGGIQNWGGGRKRKK